MCVDRGVCFVCYQRQEIGRRSTGQHEAGRQQGAVVTDERYVGWSEGPSATSQRDRCDNVIPKSEHPAGEEMKDSGETGIYMVSISYLRGE